MPATTPLPGGLSSAEARRRAAAFGANAVEEAPPPRWRFLLARFWAPVPWMLEVAIVLQIALGEYVEATVIGALLLFNAALGWIQQGRADAALTLLKQRLAPTALVLRDGAWARRPAAELVPGDVVRLPLGALVPADVRIVSGTVSVDQSALTGESMPVDAESGGAVYGGSLVRRGEAVAEVTAIGANTYFGRALELVRIAHAASTEQAAVFAATRNLAVVNGAIATLGIAYAYLIAMPAGSLIGFALTALLGTVPVALPATFTLSAALAARALAQRGVLLTRLSAAHEAAAMDILCADKTGTLTQNAMAVVDVRAMAGVARERLLALAVLASSEADQDPIDAAIHRAAQGVASTSGARLQRFIPFDPATKVAEALVTDANGSELRIVKGAFDAIATRASVPPESRSMVDALAADGHRVIAVAAGPPAAMRLAGLIAISDPPREDAAQRLDELRALGVRTIMVTGDSPATAAAIAHKIGIAGEVRRAADTPDPIGDDTVGVLARVLPEQKYRLVRALQARGHVVGMCGDGTNDAPALRQAQIGIAVASATDAAKAAAGMVLTEHGLAGIVDAVRTGRAGFRRLLTYVLAMLVKKIEIVLLLAAGLLLTKHALLTPALMVLLSVVNDLSSMSLTVDRAGDVPAPAVWRMRGITGAAMAFGACKLAFSMAVIAFGKGALDLGAGALQTLAFAAVAFGNQALVYVLRERRHLWASLPSPWVLAATAADTALVVAVAVRGVLTAPLGGAALLALAAASVGFALVLDQLKGPILRTFGIP
ncbi:MAG: HAD-IC family P-type ATPase [Mizugakiibacter sp.]|uniref:HAD-IC family P-type ATPase n=1 Tax=Mizugakiibacter sp. TaxID=1972610 RepID=UPI0031BCF285|nr:HAD-IC family P-type ATPase [Xanthomonadaceae bacterium]